MKRLFSALVSLSLLLAAPPPSAWAAVGGLGKGQRPAGVARLPVARAPLTQGAPSARQAVMLTGTPGLQPFELPSMTAPRVAPAPASAGAERAAAPAEAEAARDASGARLSLSRAAGELSEAGEDQAAREVALDGLFGERGVSDAGDPAYATVDGRSLAPLSVARAGSGGAGAQEVVPSPAGPTGPRRSRALGALKALAGVAAGAALTVALNAGAAALVPALFTLSPLAAAWAVSMGVVFLPLALWARSRLARRDSPRLAGVKVLLDVAVGAYLGALAVVAPAVFTVAGGALTLAPGFAAALAAVGPAAVLAPAGAAALGASSRGSLLLNSVGVFGVLNFAPLAVAAIAGATGGLAAAPLLGLMAITAMTTIAFFLPALIASAEAGRKFSAPGGLRALRFPTMPWVMTGTVLAVLLGYASPGGMAVNVFFGLWQFFGSRKPADWDKGLPLWRNLLNKAMDFNWAYLGLVGYIALTFATTGVLSPLVYLALAFLPERAAMWSEALLSRLVPKGKPAPSTGAEPIQEDEELSVPRGWPKFHYWTRTYLFAGLLAGLLTSLLLIIPGANILAAAPMAVVMTALTFWFGADLIQKLMKVTLIDHSTTDPRHAAIVEMTLRMWKRVNDKRAAQGKRPYGLPKIGFASMGGPNAFATGRDPDHALVVVTTEMMDMVLDPAGMRDAAPRAVELAAGKPTHVRLFRQAAASSGIPGVTEASSASELAAALRAADDESLARFGRNALEGVMAHEISHVMDRHMLSGSVMGALAMIIHNATQGFLEALLRRIGEAMNSRRERRGLAPVAVEDAKGLTAIPVAGLLMLLKLQALIWAPVVGSMAQMAGSRNNEGMADEDGARLSGRPEWLGMGLGLLMAYRPPSPKALTASEMSRLSAVASMMTVNPLLQAQEAGTLPKMGPLAAAVAGNRDDFLFNLFITHPNTDLRIERLARMAEALKDLPPPADGGSAAPRAAERKGGLWEAVKRPFRVFPDARRNRAYWNWVFGQMVATVGFNFGYSGLPAIAGSSMGHVRAAGWGGQAAGNLVAGPIVDGAPRRLVMGASYVLRALTLAAVPVLVLTGNFTLAAFAIAFALAGFLQAVSSTAVSVAFNDILGDDVGRYNRANLWLLIMTTTAGVIAPLAAGAMLAWLAGPMIGMTALGAAATMFAVFAVSLMGAAWIYGTLPLARNPMEKARLALRAELRKDSSVNVKAVALGSTHDGRPALLVELREAGDAARLPKDFSGYSVVAVPARNPVSDLIKGFRLSMKDRFLRTYLLLSTAAFASGDSLAFNTLPRFLKDVLRLDDAAMAQSFTWFLAASSIGLGIASLAMMGVKDPATVALAPAARELRGDLAARRPDLDEARLDAAALALREALPAALEAYKADPALPSESLADAVLQAAVPGVAKALSSTPEEARAMLEAGAGRDVRVWASRRGERFLKAARRDGASGWDELQRQGRWSNLLRAASWVAYAGVFAGAILLPGLAGGLLWPALAFMALAAAMAGPSAVIWSSITTRVVSQRYPSDQGKVYAFIGFFMLSAMVGGVLLFGWLLASLSTPTVLAVVAGALLVCAVLDGRLALTAFPLDRKR